MMMMIIRLFVIFVDPLIDLELFVNDVLVFLAQ